MHAPKVLQTLLKKSLPSIHASRWAALWWAVSALISSGKLTQAEMAKAGNLVAKTKHRIKKMYRLIANKLLQAETKSIYSAAAHHLLGGLNEALILVDWTPVTPGLQYYALTASTPYLGRSIQLYAEVHPEKKLGNPRVEKAFLKALADVLPQGCCPTIVTDGGFRTPWFDAVKALGWHFVGRLRNRNLFQCKKTGAWRPVKDVWELACHRALDLGIQLLTRSAPRKVRLVLIKEIKARRSKPGRKRSRKSPTNRKPRSAKSKTCNSITNAKAAAKEPWVLMTSLEDASAEQVVSIYKTRMQIEESYRDTKNSRLGWGLDHSQVLKPERIATLLLIAALGCLVAMTVGVAAEEADLAWAHQGNSIKSRRVRSLFALGVLLLRTGDMCGLTPTRIRAGIAKLRTLSAQHAYVA